MSKYNLFTDPHLNVSRQANTTTDSSQKLNQKLFTTAMAAKQEGVINIIAGDLFDKPFNPEWAIVQGMQVAQGAHVLSGNHDETNRDGTLCSLEVLNETGNQNIIRNPDISTWHFDQLGDIFFVPHHATQTLFEEALYEASLAAANYNSNHTYLIVHCNRGDAWGTLDEATLRITGDLEAKLLKNFTRIFYGHVHHPSIHENGRAVVLGNTHPTGFGDIGNKYRYELDTETNALTPVLLWDASIGYLELTLGEEIPDLTHVEFIDVKGKGTKSEVVEYLNKIWKSGENLLGVRSVVVTPEMQAPDVVDLEPANLIETIETELKDSPLLPLFIQAKEDATN